MRWRGESGVTLAELLVVLGLVSLLSGTVIVLVAGAQRNESFLRHQVDVSEDLRVALDRFARDARQGGAVSTADCDRFTFTSYFNDENPRQVDYRYDAGTLTRTVDGGDPETVATGLAAATFTTGIDFTAPLCFAPGAVSTVRLELRVTPRRATQPLVVATTVKLRNG